MLRLASFSHDARHSFGLVTDTGVIDCGARLDGRFSDLKSVLERDAIGELERIASAAEDDLSLDEINFERPIRYPEKIFCIGLNYKGRLAEYAEAPIEPTYPNVFMRTPESLVGHHTPMMRPPESEQLDYEGEIVIVIGKPGRRISESQASRHIAGLTIMNEGSIRDWLRYGKFNVNQGKNFERSGAIGPWIAPADHIERETGGYESLRLKTRVNGELRQNDTTANLMFSIRYLISYISIFTGLKAGDLIATGTPPGAGVRSDPPRFLNPGDRVDIEAEGIGTLTNTIVDE